MLKKKEILQNRFINNIKIITSYNCINLNCFTGIHEIILESYADYYISLIFIIVSFVLTMFLFIITFGLNKGTIILDDEKLMLYECGFDPINDSRNILHISFYRIAILYIIFDVEIVLLMPLLVTLSFFNINDICYFYYFILILIIGLLFELKSDMIKW